MFFLRRALGALLAIIGSALILTGVYLVGQWSLGPKGMDLGYTLVGSFRAVWTTGLGASPCVRCGKQGTRTETYHSYYNPGARPVGSEFVSYCNECPTAKDLGFWNFRGKTFVGSVIALPFSILAHLMAIMIVFVFPVILWTCIIYYSFLFRVAGWLWLD